jgi:hypothetical protein
MGGGEGGVVELRRTIGRGTIGARREHALLALFAQLAVAVGALVLLDALVLALVVALVGSLGARLDLRLGLAALVLASCSPSLLSLSCS